MNDLFKRIIYFSKNKLGLSEKEDSTESLIKNGLKVGKNFVRPSDCIIDVSHCWLINIGNNVTLTSRVIIIAHDATTKRYLGYTKIGLVTIGDDVFVGMGTIILPGVSIGNNVIIGAGSVVTMDIPSNSVAVGNPAQVICSVEEYIYRQKQKMQESHIFGVEYTRWGNISTDLKNEMIEKLSSSNGFVI